MPDEDDKTIGEKIDAVFAKAAGTATDVRKAIEDLKDTYELVKARRAARKAKRDAGDDSDDG